MRSVVDRNVVMRRIPVVFGYILSFCVSCISLPLPSATQEVLSRAQNSA